MFDLTAPLEQGMPVYPGDPPLQIERTATHEVDGFQVTRICLGTHSGTHVEAPRHFFPQGKTLDGFPLRRFVGEGVIYDCRSSADDIVDDRLARLLRTHPLGPAGIALLWTDGTSLTSCAAELLVKAGAGLVGIDAESIDEAPHPLHRYLLSHEVLIAENLKGLDRVGAGPVHCCLLPLLLNGVEAAPARAVVWR